MSLNLIESYINNITAKYNQGNATEHTFRGELQNLIENLCSDILATNEPKRQKCGAPDYVLMLKDKAIPIGYIEAKDIGLTLDKILLSKGDKREKEQYKRYSKDLENLIYTDYLQFDFIKEGEKYQTIKLAELNNDKIITCPESYQQFINLLQSFVSYRTQTITSSDKLAEMMASKARVIRDTVERALDEDIANPTNNSNSEQELIDIYQAFKDVLVYDMSTKEFSDIYAQTLTYGLFTARFHDPTLQNFSRQEAAELLPKSNPLLRRFFQHIGGYDLDIRIRWIIDDLIEIFLATDVKEILKAFGAVDQRHDPIIHFYETFLGEYDAKLRKARGVYYTPEPVVQFIVQAVDEILIQDFGLERGLADNSQINNPHNNDEQIHRVQLLDPATGTGTFLAEVIKYIYHEKFANAKGMWSRYIQNDLIPRLNGFEIMMASYAMCHLKLDLLLTELGYTPRANDEPTRFRVFLTNSLEQPEYDGRALFARWLTEEANEAIKIKKNTPIMVVLGNPPYSVSSSNKGEWITSLISDYKQDLNEKNIQPLSDDYIKFIRYAQEYIDKNKQGIVAMITNNSFIDGITHRQMRKTLMKSFDKIYIMDLHGSTKKKESCPDGSADNNVFDIQQGVSINIFVKIADNQGKEAEVYHYDLYGKRKAKYEYLDTHSLSTVSWTKLNPVTPYYFFVPKDFAEEENYNKGFKINELMGVNGSGVESQRDSIAIQFTKIESEQVRQDLITLKENEVRQKYRIDSDGRDWKLSLATKDLQENNPQLSQITYRPFDIRYSYYTGTTKGLYAYPRHNVMKHILAGDNVGLIVNKQHVNQDYSHCSLTKHINNKGTHYLGNKGNDYLFPLYLYEDAEGGQISLDVKDANIKPNLNADILKEFSQKTGLQFNNRFTLTASAANAAEYTSIDLLDYIYGVLHSPAYRQTYREFLKIDFPRVPYPDNADIFWKYAGYGQELRQLHLMTHPSLKKTTIHYPIDGDNVVDKPRYEDGKVYINDSQYFEGVSSQAWEFYIGGYQPAQKWLKDRKERELNIDDIEHYIKVCTVLERTAEIMQEIAVVEGRE